MRKSLLVLLSTCSATVWSAPYVMSPGAALTTGPISLPYSLESVAHNPAAGELVVRSDETLRTGYWSNLGGGVEYGDVTDFEDDLDELIDILDDGLTGDSSADEVIDRFSGVLADMSQEGYLKFEGTWALPIFPVVYRSEALKGTISLDIAQDVQGKASILYADDLAFNSTTQDFSTTASIYLKSGVQTRFAAGYSRPVYTRAVGQFNGTLIAGTRLNIINLKLSKQILALTNLDGESLGDVIKDEYENNQEDATNAGLDVGLIWVAEKYRLGLTMTNLNQPSFDYGKLGVNCESMTNITQQANCFVARDHIQVNGSIDGSETHTMNALTTVDASYILTERWTVSGSMELAKYDDLVGDENQWMAVSTTWFPQTMWIPAVRLGYKSNLAGSKLSSVNWGFTAFKIFNFDLAYGLESIDVDGTSVPRSFGASIGFQEGF